jgi:hypothetical protein
LSISEKSSNFADGNNKTIKNMKEIALTKEEVNVLFLALITRLNSIRGDYSCEEEHIKSIINKLN